MNAPPTRQAPIFLPDPPSRQPWKGLCHAAAWGAFIGIGGGGVALALQVWNLVGGQRDHVYAGQYSLTEAGLIFLGGGFLAYLAMHLIARVGHN